MSWGTGLKDFRDLQVWEKSHRLVLAVYPATKSFPRDELFGLTSQIRRSASSIPANIAEGCGRRTSADFARSLQIAMGSASELEYHLLMSRDLGYLDAATYQQLDAQVVEVKRMLAALIGTLHAGSPRRGTGS
ncbi:MAG TPA: four helix bundle protein [Dehalococcoidia bacterium]|nr:four helix bundle protein [Dehalococcoidia bacterium]